MQNVIIGKDAAQDISKDLVKSSLNAILKFIIAFAIGTGAGGIVCWYYSFPLEFSILGGILVLGLALALMSDTTF